MRESYQQALDGQSRFVTIAGEAGIGKTTLVDHLVASIPPEEMTLAYGSCYDLVTTPLFGPWIEAIDGLAAAHEAQELPALFDFNPTRGDVSGPGDLLDDAAGWIAERAAERPLLLVLEDFHWADRASIELLRILTRQVFDLPLLTIMTYRSVELDRGAPLYGLLPQVVREGRPTRIELPALAPEALHAIVAARYGMDEAETGRLARWLRDLAGGNPFFCDELLYSLERRGLLREAGRSWTLGELNHVQVPVLIRQLVDQRLAGLEDDDRQILQIASVIGPSVPFPLWEEMSGIGEERLYRVFETAQTLALVEEETGTESFRFRHALIQRSLYENLSLPRRQHWHRRVGEIRAAHERQNAEAIANHFALANDQRAAFWLVQAGRHAIDRFAWETATVYLKRALEFLPDDDASTESRGWIHLYIGRYLRRGDLEAATIMLEQAINLARLAGSLALEGNATATLGLIRCLQGQTETGLHDMETAIALLDRQDASKPEADPADDLLSALRHEMPAIDRHVVRAAWINWLAISGRFQQARERGERFIEQMPELMASDNVAPPYDYHDALVGLAQSYLYLGKPKRAFASIDQIERTEHVIQSIPGIYWWTLFDVVVAYAFDQPEERQRTEEAVPHWWRSLRITDAVERLDNRPPLFLYHYGEWDAALRLLAILEQRAAVGFTSRATRLLRARIARRRGDRELGWAIVRELLGGNTPRPFGDGWHLATTGAQRLAAGLALDAGDLDEAIRWIDSFNNWQVWSGSVINKAEIEIFHAHLYRSRGQTARAVEAAQRAVLEATTPRQPIILCEAHRTHTELLITAGKLEEADLQLARAVNLADQIPDPYQAAQVEMTSALLSIARGESEPAAERLTSARQKLELLEALPALERLSALEGKISSPKADDPEYPAGLSAREVEVLQQVAHGLTDAQVGAALHISPRTVSRHLQTIYAKLEVNSRTAASAFAFQHGLVASEDS